MSNNAAKAWARWQTPAMQDELVATNISSATASFHHDEAALESREESRRAGWEQGLTEGRIAARGELGLQAERVRQIIEQLASPLAQVGEEVKEELVLLAMAIAQQVLQRELTTQAPQIHDIVTQAIAALPIGIRHLRIHLHPEDAHLLSANVEMHEGSTWKLIEDASITRGGCLVDSGASRIDARVETRLHDIFTRLQSHGAVRGEST